MTIEYRRLKNTLISLVSFAQISSPHQNTKTMTVFFYLQAGLIAIVGFLVYKFYLYPQFLSPLRLIPGPPNQSYFFGNLQHIFDSPAGIGHHSLVQQYGPTVRYYGMFASDRLVLTDPASLHHVLLTKSYEYPKPSQVRGDLGRVSRLAILIPFDRHTIEKAQEGKYPRFISQTYAIF